MLHARPIGAHDVEHEVSNAHVCVCIKIICSMLGIVGDIHIICLQSQHGGV